MQNSTHVKPFKPNKITNKYPIRNFHNVSVSTEYLPPNFDTGVMRDTNNLLTDTDKPTNKTDESPIDNTNKPTDDIDT